MWTLHIGYFKSWRETYEIGLYLKSSSIFHCVLNPWGTLYFLRKLWEKWWMKYPTQFHHSSFYYGIEKLSLESHYILLYQFWYLPNSFIWYFSVKSGNTQCRNCLGVHSWVLDNSVLNCITTLGTNIENVKNK